MRGGREGFRERRGESCEKLNRLHLKKRARSDKESEAVTSILSAVQLNESCQRAGLQVH